MAAAQMSFGTILREAREKKHLDLTMVARRLRIRPDILEAIEDADFSRMPPRGYTRNMVNAYAHFLGLNATDVTRMYLDECYAYQVGSARRTSRGHGFDMSAGRRGSVPQGQLRDNGTGRRRYSDGYRTEETSRMQRMRDEQNRTHRSSRRAVEDIQYTNFYSGPRSNGSGGASRLPFIVAGVVILILVIIVCVLLFGRGSGASQQEQQVMPVTGVESTASTETSTQETQETQQAVTETAPTEMTIGYDVPSGASAYIEIYVDGAVEVADTIDGPDSGEYTTSGTVEIVCVTYSGTVTFTQDGEEIELEEGSGGVSTITIDFADVLAAWNEEHPNAASSTNSTSTTSEESESSESSETTSAS